MMISEKKQAAAWFKSLQDVIVRNFEEIEKKYTPASSSLMHFTRRQTKRKSSDGNDAGGGEMALLKGGALFEKVGVNFSEVYGELSRTAQKQMALRALEKIEQDPQFWASGISLVAHMKNPHIPAVHMNTRMFWTASKWWFGGGVDLNPAIEYASDRAYFHGTLKAALEPHGKVLYPRFKSWADEYFYMPHRGRMRGVGGIFADDVNSGDWAADFALIQDIGRAFLPAFLPLVEKRARQKWQCEDKQKQLVYRGLYTEYNLIYDRGTRFGLQSGHDADAVLMSLPPLASWPG